MTSPRPLVTITAPLPLKVCYALVILNLVLPVNLLSSGWGLITRSPGFVAAFSILMMLLLIGLGFYRIFLVATVPRLLDAPGTATFQRLLRRLGAILVYVGAVAAILGWAGFASVVGHAAQGYYGIVALYLAAIYFVLAAGGGLFGLVLFEGSRLLGFEERARAAAP